VLASNTRALIWGLASGLAGAFGVSRLLRSMLNGVSPLDPLAYAAVFALLIAAAAAASALPARRAARVDPVTALRWE
jgi:ABC-type antimicrobial peptide transport system permease subunit